jgi:membrane associated rhomboid family serine protease
VSAPELSVVCKSCGSEVSPYVTECPYCGARLRKRAPKLQRGGEGLEARPRRRRVKFGRPSLGALDVARPYATIAVIAASAAMLLIQQATGDGLFSLGGITGPIGSEWWRYLTAPFVYIDLGYLFVVAVGLALFAPGLERRLGSVPTLILLIGCGALGMVAANAIDPPQVVVFGATGVVGFSGGLSGGNGIALGALAAWTAIRYMETRRAIDEDFDVIGVAVCAAALLLLPAFDNEANVWAGLGGALVGGAAGFAAAIARPRE